jgi:hypothetical protein
MPAKLPNKKSQGSAGKSGSSFAQFKGWFREMKQYFVSLGVAITAFVAFQAILADKLGVPKWAAWLAFIPPVVVFLCKTVPRLLEWRHERVFVITAEKDATKAITSASAASYFLIGPYGEERRGKYMRADGMHVTVLDWLQKTDERTLILTGLSGTGKSSLLNAFVIPALRESKPPCTVLLVRSFDNPLDNLRSQFLNPGVIWDKPPTEKSELSLIELIQRAVTRLRKRDANARLFAVFDQFEELIVLQAGGSPVVAEMKALLGELQRAKLEGFVLLLSVRLDYCSFLEPLGVPALNLRKNWQDVPAFTFSDSARFITAPESGLQIAQERLQRVLTDAAAVDQTQGLIRPIVLNMLGSVLRRIADSPIAELPTRSLLVSDLRAFVNHKERRTVVRTILPQMLTDTDTRHPRRIGELSEATGLESQVILGCLLNLELSGYVRQISRPPEIANRIWEVSHDFVARLLGQILKTPFQTFWERVGRVLYPLSLSLWAIAAISSFMAVPWFEDINAERILRDQYKFHLEEKHGDYTAFQTNPNFRDLVGALPYLQKLNRVTSLLLYNCSGLTDINGISELQNLKELNLSRCHQLTNVDALRELTHLQTLDLSLCRNLANVHGLVRLKNLRKLNLANCPALTDVEDLRALKDLRELDISNCGINFVSIRQLKADLPHTTIVPTLED